MRLLYLSFIIFFPLLSIAQVPVAKKSLDGTYLAQAFEKDSILNKVVPVYLKLTLSQDSTFSFLKQSESGNCNNNRAGYWNSHNGIINLDFIGEEPLAFSINEGPNYLSLVNKVEKLVLFKQQPRLFEDGQQPKQFKSNNRKRKGPPCPSF
ncbi:MAG: hypothetical protein H0X62_07580 [Bacteroidetes bacterium]|nr:hypothetical protein [Bacteroidota bacterium]